jgi:hypothetical protein
MENIENAKRILESGGYTCVFYDGKSTLASKERGVAPLLKLLKSGEDLRDYCAADKVVGKAAAFLYVLLGVKQLYAAVISEPALETLSEYNIETSFGQRCDYIVNRQKDGRCPMESAVLSAKDPREALALIENKIKELKK